VRKNQEMKILLLSKWTPICLDKFKFISFIYKWANYVPDYIVISNLKSKRCFLPKHYGMIESRGMKV
jgi:hypothetical protein